MSFVITGCKTKPNPSDTVMHEGPGQGGIGGIGDIDSDPIPPYGPDEGLSNRPTVDYDMTQVDKTILKPVYYAFDQSHIRPGERSKLQEAADYLNKNPNTGILIEGYCDWRGTTEYNLGLGDRRANSARNYLENLGINPDRIRVASKGDLEAVVNGTSEQMSHDRRADLGILR